MANKGAMLIICLILSLIHSEFKWELGVLLNVLSKTPTMTLEFTA